MNHEWLPTENIVCPFSCWVEARTAPHPQPFSLCGGRVCCGSNAQGLVWVAVSKSLSQLNYCLDCAMFKDTNQVRFWTFCSSGWMDEWMSVFE